jgi:anti-sigma B factor antagonist
MLIKIVHTQPGCVELAISGDLDLATADELLHTATAALTDHASDDLVLDLSEVTFIDSTGLGALVAIRNATRDRAVTLHLRDAAPPVHRLMKITNLDTAFNISTSQT